MRSVKPYRPSVARRNGVGLPRSHCIGGAWTSHQEDRKGRVAPGFLADLVVLDRDPGAVAPEEIREVKVTMTFAGGKLVYSR